MVVLGYVFDSIFMFSAGAAGRLRLPAKQLAAHFLDALLAGDGLARALAGAGVGAGALAADGQAAAVPEAAGALDVLQALGVVLHLAAQRAFGDVLAVEEAHDAGDLLVGQVAGAALRIDVGLVAQLQGRGRADAVNVPQRDVRRLVVGQIDTEDTRHGGSPGLALALLVTRVAADHVQLALPPYQLAVFTDPLDTGANFHDCLPSPVWRKIVEIISVATTAKPARGKNPATAALPRRAEPRGGRRALLTGMRRCPQRTPHPREGSRCARAG